MGVNQDIDMGKEHFRRPSPTLEPLLVLVGIKRPRRIEVDSGAGMHTSNGHQLEQRSFRWVSTLDRIAQNLGDKGAHTEAAGFSCTPDLLCQLVIQGDRGAHYAQHN